jgi:colanic acid/amylovoran biosynthesis glycosyltransferase
MRMKLAVISSRYPSGTAEPFLGVELGPLRELVGEIVVVPVRSDLLAFATFTRACATLVRAPGRSLSALRTILCARSRLGVTMKNLAVYPRALALAEDFRRQRVDHVHAYWLSTPATAAFVVARVNGIPWSATAHRRDIFEENMIPEKARSALFLRAVSSRGKAELCARAPDSAQKIAVVRLGTALQSKPAENAGCVERRMRLLCAAAFIATKGHADLVAAVCVARRAFSSLHLTLCGKGPLENAVRRQIAALGLNGTIEMRGYVPRDVLLREMAQGAYDAAILASRDDGLGDMEGVPSFLIEAASLGIACIATRSGSICELLDDGSAFLSAPQRPDLLAREILAATDPLERRRRAKRAADRSRLLHDPARSAAEFGALLGVSA